MAQKFSKAFYNSKEWQSVRSYCLMRDKYLCVHCGKPAEEVHHKIHLTPQNIGDKSISLNADNLVCLCKDCHFEQHKLDREHASRYYNDKKKHIRIVNDDGTYFDENGMLCMRNVYIVYGCPRSGKTTYVRNHKEVHDVVIDVDAIIGALQLSDDRYVDNNLQFLALDIRDYLISELEKKNRNFDCKNVWIIGGFPDANQRNELAKRLNAKTIFIECSFEIAEQRAKESNLYNDSKYSAYVVKEWFKKYTK